MISTARLTAWTNDPLQCAAKPPPVPVTRTADPKTQRLKGSDNIDKISGPGLDTVTPRGNLCSRERKYRSRRRVEIQLDNRNAKIDRLRTDLFVARTYSEDKDRDKTGFAREVETRLRRLDSFRIATLSREPSYDRRPESFWAYPIWTG